MAVPSYTYTLANSTTADADEVMQNFNDILNGVSDGSKDLSISALTVAGAATFNGAVTLGNATGDDLTATGRWAADMDPKTAATYALGSATQPWSELHVDKGATDGGAVYFGGTSTGFLKSSVDGTTLNVGGFAKIDGDADFEILGRTTNSGGTAGYVGEVIEATGSFITTLGTSIGDIANASLALTAGTWLIHYNVMGGFSTGSTAGDNCGIITAITNAADTVVGGYTRERATTPAAAFLAMETQLQGSTVVNLSGSDTHKLRGYYFGTVTGTPSISDGGTENSYFFAVRIA